jgi:hypothetical protein
MGPDVEDDALVELGHRYPEDFQKGFIPASQAGE